MYRHFLVFAVLFSLLIFPFSTRAIDSTSYDPTTVSVRVMNNGVPIGTIIAWPVSTNPDDWDKWLECNGQAIDRTAYPELYAIVGSNVPNLQGRFLRGLQAGHNPLDRVEDTLGSHNHEIQPHTHNFNGQLVSGALSGTAAGQKFSTI